MSSAEHKKAQRKAVSKAFSHCLLMNDNIKSQAEKKALYHVPPSSSLRRPPTLTHMSDNDKSLNVKRNIIRISFFVNSHIVSGYEKTHHFSTWRCEQWQQRASKIVWLNYVFSCAAEMFMILIFRLLSSGDFSSSSSCFSFLHSWLVIALLVKDEEFRFVCGSFACFIPGDSNVCSPKRVRGFCGKEAYKCSKENKHFPYLPFVSLLFRPG